MTLHSELGQLSPVTETKDSGIKLDMDLLKPKTIEPFMVISRQDNVKDYSISTNVVNKAEVQTCPFRVCFYYVTLYKLSSSQVFYPSIVIQCKSLPDIEPSLMCPISILIGRGCIRPIPG